ncbi:MAG: hypothetical protein U5R31_11070 [Acidimicrobiia bacterium]|nr:hypothetical protein [Acidimicrobiia bacterium]
MDLVDVEDLQRGAGADHVDDGVDAADLVEVDLLGRPPVQPPLGFGQGGERGERTRPDALGQPGLLDEPGDVRSRANHRGRFRPDVDLGGTDATPEHRLGLEAPTGDGEPATDLTHLVEVGTGVDQRAHGHVAGDPREAVEPGERGRSGAHGAAPAPMVRTTAQAAP